MHNCIKLSIALLVISLHIYGYGQRLSTLCESLTWGIGGRAAGMGEAFCAVSDDITAIYWNPAGLVQLNSLQIGFMHSKILPKQMPDLYHDFIGIAQPYKWGALGIASIFALLGKHPNVHPLVWYLPETHLGEFSWREGAPFIVSCAYKISDNLAAGVNLKLIGFWIDNFYDHINGKIYDIKKSTFALDLGLLFKINDALKFGAKIENISSKFRLARPIYDPFPLDIRVGIAYKLAYLQNQVINFAFDVHKPIYEDILGKNIGLEWEIWRILQLHMGYYDKGGGVEGVTLAVGIIYKNLMINFAQVPWGELGRTPKVSCNFSF